MAKDTYYALDKEKRNRILNACIKEFSEHPFSKASINRIIKHADIPRGSFYQYFENKEDCYLEVLTEIGKVKLELYQELIIDHPQENFFEKSLLMIQAIEALITKYPHYHQIGLLMEKDNDPFINKLMIKSPELLEPVYQQIKQDQTLGILRKDIEPKMIYEILEALQKSLFAKAAQQKDYQSIYKQAQDLYRIIYEGIKA